MRARSLMYDPRWDSWLRDGVIAASPRRAAEFSGVTAENASAWSSRRSFAAASRGRPTSDWRRPTFPVAHHAPAPSTTGTSAMKSKDFSDASTTRSQ